MNRKRPAADVAQCVECRPDRLEAKGSVPSTTSDGLVETQRSVMECLPFLGWKLEVPDVSLTCGLSQLEVSLDYIRLHQNNKRNVRQEESGVGGDGVRPPGVQEPGR